MTCELLLSAQLIGCTYFQMESYELKYQLVDRNAPLEFVGYAAEGRLSSASA